MRDWVVEWQHPSLSRAQVAMTALYYENALTRRSVRRARRVFVPARCLADRVRRKYRLSQAPTFLPTPIRLPPPSPVVKAAQPTVCFVGRLDRRKRPDVAMALAPVFPEVRFIVAGAGQDAAFTRALQRRYAGLPNVEFRGFVDQFAGTELSGVLSQSWVLLSTSVREGLPNSFIEACGHGCAILSAVDPDGFATRFGCRVNDGDFAAGLRRLLNGNAWRDAGARGCEYVRATNAAAPATDQHLQEYCRYL